MAPAGVHRLHPVFQVVFSGGRVAALANPMLKNPDERSAAFREVAREGVGRASRRAWRSVMQLAPLATFLAFRGWLVNTRVTLPRLNTYGHALFKSQLPTNSTARLAVFFGAAPCN